MLEKSAAMSLWLNKQKCITSLTVKTVKKNHLQREVTGCISYQLKVATPVFSGGKNLQVV